MLPTGPVSAWPKERNVAGKSMEQKHKDPEILRSPAEMAKGLGKVALQGIRHGKVSKEVREERYDVCKACPMFRKKDKRCADCGCYMEAKTWVGGDPDILCPQQKWKR